MCYGQVDLNALCKRFDKPLNTLDFAKEGLDHLQKDGLCSYKEGRLTLLPKGRLFQRLVASCFDPYFEKGVRRRHAQAV
jgi:coproporphyrinogen III oxidase-like Fe-S oxidoreductase